MNVSRETFREDMNHMIAFKEVLIFIISTFGLSLIVFILLLVAETILYKIISYNKEDNNNEQNRK